MGESSRGTVAQAAACDDAFVRVLGGGGAGKTAAVVERAATLLAADVSPDEIRVIAATRSAAAEVRARLSERLGTLCPVPVSTAAQLAVEVLSTSEAERATGRFPRVLADFEKCILVEDMKVTGVSGKRLREMLKFFFRVWTELGETDEGFIIDAEERAVHDAVLAHLTSRKAMLRCELSNVACRYLEGNEPARAVLARSYVLVDDFENLSRASQVLAELSCSRQLFVCGCANELVETTEPYPYVAGLLDFEIAHPESRTFLLDRSLRMPARATALAESLVERGGLDASTPLVVPADAREGTVKFVNWTYPNDEFRGIARYVKHRVLGDAGCAPVRPHRVFIAVPNALWGRAIGKILEANQVKCDVLTSYHGIGGDPRDNAKCAGLRALTGLNLVADLTDAVAWRSWCGFGDYLTNSNHWCRLEERARTTSRDVVDVLAALASGEEEPFLGSDLLSERYRAGIDLARRVGDRRGFAVLNALRDEGQREAPCDFLALVEPVAGSETPMELLERARGRLERTFDDADAVRIGLPQMAIGLDFDVVILTGAVDGFYPDSRVYDLVCDEERANAIRAQERRTWYSLISKTCDTFVLSCFSRDEANTAAALGMHVHRMRNEGGKSLAVLAFSPYLDELGGAAPGLDSTL